MRSFFQELLWVHTLVFGQSVSPTHVLPYPRRRARRGRALNDLTYPESSAPDAVLLACVRPGKEPYLSNGLNPTSGECVVPRL